MPSLDTLTDRIRAEFGDLPGLKVTFAQACRLWHADEAKCLAALEALIDEESKQILRCAYSRLPEKQRLTLMLRVQEERKFEEIAGIMKCSIGTAKANYHHAVQKLKGMLGEEKTGESGVRSRESGDPGNEVQ